MAKLTKIGSVHKLLRTDTVEGSVQTMPKVGGRFEMVAPPLEGGTIRLVSTSVIQKVIENSKKNEIVFHTLYSKYKLEDYKKEKSNGRNNT